MSPTSGIALEPDALLRARHQLLRHELLLSPAGVDPPDTGATSALTAAVLDRVAAAVAAVAADLHGLADALQRFVDDVTAQEGEVTMMFDLLRMRGLS